MATPSATAAYRDRHEDTFASGYFRRFAGAAVSSIGVGTYLGDPTAAADRQYHDAIVEALESGINVVDTAVNYRHQRSERVVGDALDTATIDRGSVLVATKGGFVPYDDERPADASAYIESEFLDSGLLDRGDLVLGNCITPEFLEWSLERSRANLEVDTVDLYYVHNPEAQLARFDRETVYDRLEDAFTRLEKRAAAGDIRHYGVATWEAFRVPSNQERHLSLPEVLERARAAAGRAGADETHFQAIQLPLNARMSDAATNPVHEGKRSALDVAAEAGLDVFTSSSIMQGDLADEAAIPDPIEARVGGETPVQQALNFARSAPAVTSALVGTGSPEHVAENRAAGTIEPLDDDAFERLLR